MSTTSMDVQASLKAIFGFDHFKGNQQKIIESLLSGKDTFVIKPTGGGKSLCYQLPALMQEGTTIVVSPLIALMKNQVDSLRGLSTQAGVAHVWNSSLTKKELNQVKADLEAGITKLLYVAPESLNKEDNIEFFKNLPINFYAIDEAHCISEWGHDFRPEYRNLKQAITKIGKKPIIALTATATPKVQNDIMKTLQMENAEVFKSSFNRENLYYEIRPKVNIDKEIIKVLKDNPGKSGIVYCLSRQKVEDMAQTLQVNGIKALPYHAGMDGNTRIKHQDAFINEDVDIIVATIAFGMGIDKPDVRYVIHYDMPKSLESYYQETGRAGRDGGEGNLITFYSWKDVEKMEKFLAKKPVAEQEIGKQLLQEAMGYAETSACRRKYILHYFGEEFNAEDCNEMCDNCRHPKKKFDAQEDFKRIINVIAKSNHQFKAEQVINTLLGKLTAILKTYKADEMDEFGSLKDSNEIYIGNILRQGVILGYLKKDIEKYGILAVTEKGNEYLKNPEPLLVAEEVNYDQIELDAGKVQPAKGAALDDVLYKSLKDITKKVAKQKNVPPFAVFSDMSLQEMAINYPCSLDELKNISGVGEGKARKFGKPLVEAISNYVEENDIDRPMDFVVKTLANKSVLKVYIIQSTDRKLPLEDIAKAKGLSMENLLNEMEMIVNSGTKVDLNYVLEDMLDEDSLEEIYDFFMESETGDIQEAIEEFDGDYSDEELRLVKLKFLSEVAN